VVQDLQPRDRKFSEFAVQTYIKAQEWGLAGDVYYKEKQYKKAADLYMRAKNYLSAAKAFVEESIFFNSFFL
jgi:hypothetical protein